MQFRTLSIASALAAFVVLSPVTEAAECTKDQLKALEKLEEDDAMTNACPDTDSGAGSFDFEKIDPKAWAKASPCANTTCVTYMKAQATKVPNCEIKKVNVQTHYNNQLTLCMDIASGKLTAAEIEKRLGNVTDDWFGSGYDEWFGSGSDDFDHHEVKHKHKGSKTLGSNATVTTNSTTTAPTPVPTKKSGAMTTVLTSGLALVVAVVASVTV